MDTKYWRVSFSFFFSLYLEAKVLLNDSAAKVFSSMKHVFSFRLFFLIIVLRTFTLINTDNKLVFWRFFFLFSHFYSSYIEAKVTIMNIWYIPLYKKCLILSFSLLRYTCFLFSTCWNEKDVWCPDENIVYNILYFYAYKA